jgi:hypothetical protein
MKVLHHQLLRVQTILSIFNLSLIDRLVLIPLHLNLKCLVFVLCPVFSNASYVTNQSLGVIQPWEVATRLVI